jgi:hypothetical protein
MAFAQWANRANRANRPGPFGLVLGLTLRGGHRARRNVPGHRPVRDRTGPGAGW